MLFPAPFAPIRAVIALTPETGGFVNFCLKNLAIAVMNSQMGLSYTPQAFLSEDKSISSRPGSSFCARSFQPGRHHNSSTH